MLIKKYALNKHVRLLTRLYGTLEMTRVDYLYTKGVALVFLFATVLRT